MVFGVYIKLVDVGEEEELSLKSVLRGLLSETLLSALALVVYLFSYPQTVVLSLRLDDCI